MDLLLSIIIYKNDVGNLNQVNVQILNTVCCFYFKRTSFLKHHHEKIQQNSKLNKNIMKNDDLIIRNITSNPNLLNLTELSTDILI
ncbi:unnamed protein product [Rhizophagus irregularis]|nr:unnamed protein product [Rhizophagus irregularis]